MADNTFNLADEFMTKGRIEEGNADIPTLKLMVKEIYETSHLVGSQHLGPFGANQMILRFLEEAERLENKIEDLETRESKQLRVVKLNENALIPVRGSKYAAGLDLFVCRDITISPGKIVKAPTGIAVSIPQGYYGRVAPRSGLSLRGIDVLAGVVDSDYRGEISVILINLSDEEVVFTTGSKIAQLIITSCLIIDPIEVSSLSSTERNDKGFGSTGV